MSGDLESLKKKLESATSKAATARDAMLVAIDDAIATEIESSEALSAYWKCQGLSQKHLNWAASRSWALYQNRIFVRRYADRPLRTNGFYRSFFGAG